MNLRFEDGSMILNIYNTSGQYRGLEMEGNAFRYIGTLNAIHY
jgi:hypothetical protein